MPAVCGDEGGGGFGYRRRGAADSPRVGNPFSRFTYLTPCGHAPRQRARILVAVVYRTSSCKTAVPTNAFTFSVWSGNGSEKSKRHASDRARSVLDRTTRVRPGFVSFCVRRHCSPPLSVVGKWIRQQYASV